MSNETKDKTAAEQVAGKVAEAAQAVGNAIAGNTESAGAVGKVLPEAMTEATQKAASKGKKPGKGKSQTDGGESALQSVGKAACKRHGLAVVWVTDDGQCFDQENNARAHGKNLENPEPLKVEA